MSSPSRFSHYVLRTNRPEELVKWYCTVLDAHVVYTNGKLNFLTYDSEHHRIAIIAGERLNEKPPQPSVGMYHAAFGFNTLKELMDNYERLRGKDIVPYRSVNHGPTLSLYYRDADMNDVELMWATLKDATAADEFMRTEIFARTPMGLKVEPDDLLAKHRAGVPDADLVSWPGA